MNRVMNYVRRAGVALCPRYSAALASSGRLQPTRTFFTVAQRAVNAAKTPRNAVTVLRAGGSLFAAVSPSRGMFGWAFPWKNAASSVPSKGQRRVFAQVEDFDLAEVVIEGNVSVAALKEAIVHKLQLGVPPHRVLIKVGDKGALPLDGRKTVDEAGVVDATTIIVEVLPTSDAKLSAEIEYRLALKKGKGELVKASFSAAKFDKLIQGRSFLQVRESNDKPIKPISDLAEALEAANEKGTYLILKDAAAILWEDVFSLNGFVKNYADAFEERSNKAIETSEDLKATYGDLEAANNGKSITVMEEVAKVNNGKGSNTKEGKKQKQAHVEFDGLILNTTVVLVNEAKTTLSMQHISEVEGKVVKLKALLDKERARINHNEPHSFSAQPEGILERLSKLNTIIPVASCQNFEEGVAEACQKKGIYLLQRNGEGFSFVVKCQPTGPTPLQ